jgi:hypothetical protein
VWHASVALLNVAKGKTLRVDNLSEMNKAILIETAKSLLCDVGQLPSTVEQFELAIHYRRSLTDVELSGLPAAWCAIAPVDEGGLGIVLERDT